jgi:hypothetical protein
MSPKEFFDKVVKMRAAQKEYFKFRSTSNLNTSKRLEKEIDDEISRVQKIEEARRNPQLF